MIFLTGGTGLLGLHILAELTATGTRVTAAARTPKAAATLRALGAEPLEGSIDDPALWRRVGDAAAVVHSAAVIARGAGWDEYRQVNVEGTALAAARARELGIPLIHISSVAVYGEGAGNAPAGTVGEDWPLGSRSHGGFYPRSKRLAEDAVWAEAGRGLRAIVLRPCVVYGEGDRLFLPGIARMARQGWFPLVGSGTLPLAIVHARSVALAVLAALHSRQGWGRAYNITNDDEITGLEFTASLEEGLGRRVRTVRIPAPLAFGVAGLFDTFRRLVGTTIPGVSAAFRFLRGGNPYTSEAARTALGWRPAIRHREALPRALGTV
jgi:nucleoside-diphosphate-sugar epimerase